jgi:hypothetical protein
MRKGLIICLMILFAVTAVWGFWISYSAYHSILLGVFSAVAGFVPYLYRGWRRHSDNRQ